MSGEAQVGYQGKVPPPKGGISAGRAPQGAGTAPRLPGWDCWGVSAGPGAESLTRLRELPVCAARPEMADENEELPADEELPAPAEEGFEQLENDSPAERSGHVAVTDGRCMYVWGGYKVQPPGTAAHPAGTDSGKLFLLPRAVNNS